MIQVWTKIRSVSAAVAFLFGLYSVAYGESIPASSQATPELHLSIISHGSGRTIVQKVETLEVIGNRLDVTEPVKYYKTFCGGSPVDMGVANLLDKVSILQAGEGRYDVDVRISKITGYREQNESVTVPGSYFLEMCQVFEPQIETKHRIWSVREQNGAISFSRQLNGRIVKIHYRKKVLTAKTTQKTSR